MSTHDEPMVLGSLTYSRELERLSQRAPAKGIYPVSVDPQVNRTLADLAFRSSQADELKSLVDRLGIQPPPIPDGYELGGIGCFWLGDDDVDNPGIAAWDIYNPEDEEP